MPTLEEILKAQQEVEASSQEQAPEFSASRAALAGFSGLGREGGPLAAMERARQSYQAPAKEALAAKRESLNRQKTSALDAGVMADKDRSARLRDPQSQESLAAQDTIQKKMGGMAKFFGLELPKDFTDSYVGKSYEELDKIDPFNEGMSLIRQLKAEKKDSGDRAQLQRERNEAIQDRQNNAMLERYSKKLTDSGITQLGDTLDEIEGLLSTLPKDKAGKPSDIPGYGRAASVVPNILTFGKGRQMRSAVGKLANVQLKQRSGAAVTVPEFQRFLQEFGSGNFESEEALVTGISRLRRALEADRAELERGLTPEAKDEHVRRGGRLSDYQSPLAKQSQQKAPADMNDEELEIRKQELLKRSGR